MSVVVMRDRAVIWMAAIVIMHSRMPRIAEIYTMISAGVLIMKKAGVGDEAVAAKSTI